MKINLVWKSILIHSMEHIESSTHLKFMICSDYVSPLPINMVQTNVTKLNKFELNGILLQQIEVELSNWELPKSSVTKHIPIYHLFHLGLQLLKISTLKFQPTENVYSMVKWLLDIYTMSIIAWSKNICSFINFFLFKILSES